MLLQLLIVGQTERAEASPLADWIRKRLSPAETKAFAGLAEALPQLRSQGWNPDLVVIVQSWPDEYSPDEINQLSRLAPLARWVVCFGSWCESDGRTRDLWPLAVRVPLRSAESRLAHEWRLLNGDLVASLPMSASREEAFGVDHTQLSNAAGTVVVAISSADPAYHTYLSELLTHLGHSVIEPWEDCVCPDVWLVDLDPWESQIRCLVQQIHEQFPKSKLIGVMNLPAPELTSEIIELGVVRVLPKLCSQQLLLEAVAQHAPSNSRPA